MASKSKSATSKNSHSSRKSVRSSSKSQENAKYSPSPNSSDSARSINTSLRSKKISAYQGPIKERQCTDVSCLFVFMVAILGWIAIVNFVVLKTDKHFNLKPMDSFGNSCGRGKFQDKPYVFFFNLLECGLSFSPVIIDGCNGTPQVCVSQCPNKTFSVYDQLEVKNTEMPAKNTNHTWLDYVICKYNVKPTLENIEALVRSKSCAPIYFASEPVFGRCIPTVVQLTNNKVVDYKNDTMKDMTGKAITINSVKNTTEGLNLLLTANTFFKNVLQDLTNSWKWIAIMVVFGLVLSNVWVYSLYCFARIIVWLSLLLTISIFAVLTYFCIDRYKLLSFPRSDAHYLVSNSSSSGSRSGMNGAHQDPVSGSIYSHLLYYFRDALLSKIDEKLSTPWVWLVLSIVVSFILVLILLSVVLLASRINLATELINETSRAMANLRCTMLFPLIPYTMQMIVFVLWFLAAIIIFGAGRRTFLTPDLQECDPQEYESNNKTGSDCALRQLLNSKSVLNAQFYNLFVFLWVIQFLKGCYIMSLAGSFSYYYWRPNQKSMPSCTLARSSYTTIRYHMGTVAFGSLLIAILRQVQFIIQFIYKRLKNAANSTDPGLFVSIPCILKTLQALLYIFEKLMTFINRNAFITTAIYGKSYCHASIESFELTLNNKLRAIILYSISLYLMFISKLCVTFLTGTVAYHLFHGKLPGVNQWDDFSYLHIPLAPVIVTIFITFLVAGVYIDVYEVGIDTMFLCFLIDEKLNDGSKARPFFMPNSVRERMLMLDR